MKSLQTIPFSVLDLSPIVEGSNATESFRRSLTLAKRAEELGFNRFWVAEHHNMPGIASSATSVLIGYLASGTHSIRVGSGGIMLPNHPPLVIAEQFGTLESMYPGRIDLGLGRAPGTDGLTTKALRREQTIGGQEFPELLDELMFFFAEASPGQKVRAVPGYGIQIPIWLLGSSLYSAELAGRLGLPFSFAAHFAPELMNEAIEVYRKVFQPSQCLDEPYLMLGVNVIAAEKTDEAKDLATSQFMSFLHLIRGNPQPLAKPIPFDDLTKLWSPMEKSIIQSKLQTTFIGSRDKIQDELINFVDSTQADELIIHSMIYDLDAQIKSYEIIHSLKTSDKILEHA
ncbi:LLM class flavin-dependent oxidoreductase [Leptospira sp. GIMC2001]|uniref:LLM class flavin-dependent oxidoreductase n=1 Tax=Leptospira sp. GIMC2001 TaxID=1513297 RepID=UPI00234A96BA|nr:LLM class flavin-dependent oxidoreductase [Leptospira sp. GIMC2001]WCL49181.1 LLM class flavin-dependent oxidoreductase [Leptospira sp. GIMC2001]